MKHASTFQFTVEFFTDGVTQTNTQDAQWQTSLTTASSTYWAPDEPNGSSFEVVLFTQDGWKDRNPNVSQDYVCEHRNGKSINVNGMKYIFISKSLFSLKWGPCRCMSYAIGFVI